MKPAPAARRARLDDGERARLEQKLEEANQELDAFRYSVSHDLRAPLRHILGYADILRAAAGPTLDDASRQHLQTLAQSAARLGKMMDALLELSRIGRPQDLLKPVSLAALVEEARQQLRGEIAGREIHWQIGDLPEVRGDPRMLRLAVVHLLSNAIEYTRTRPTAKIEIGARTAGRETVVFVRDNGIGFDMKCAGRLFGAFQRFHPPDEFEGTGIGLATVRRIIHQHGGRTWAEAKPDGGATFYFSIPEPPKAAT